MVKSKYVYYMYLTGTHREQMESQVFIEPSPTNLRKSQVEEFGELVANTVGLDIGSALEPIVKKLGGEIDNGWSEDELNGGSIVAFEQNSFTIFLSAFTSPIRDRFTIAHELGHLFLHLPAIKRANPDAAMRATRSVDPNDKNQQRAEWEANWFAAGFLMPKTEFMLTLSSGDDYNAAKFNVSKKAAEIRRMSLS